jgi:hypothetical protein
LNDVVPLLQALVELSAGASLFVVGVGGFQKFSFVAVHAHACQRTSAFIRFARLFLACSFLGDELMFARIVTCTQTLAVCAAGGESCAPAPPVACSVRQCLTWFQLFVFVWFVVAVQQLNSNCGNEKYWYEVFVVCLLSFHIDRFVTVCFCSDGVSDRCQVNHKSVFLFFCFVLFLF